MNRPLTVMAVTMGLTVAGCLGVGGPATGGAAVEPTGGYLSHAGLQALADTVPAAPVPGSPRYLADIAASDRLRSLEGSDRWSLATRHAELRPALAVSHFDCALETRLSADDSPRLVALLARVLHDANEAAELAKARAFRSRPVSDDPERVPCQVVSAAGRASPSYPSGSATVGAAYGATFAAVASDRATQSQRIGHEIAVSRAVCGMHYPSDVTSGETLGQAVFDQIEQAPAFQADLALAADEVLRARASGLTSPACAAERSALAMPLP